ncbi:peroxisomal targeting signal 2 receptor [Serendipita sp. 397]|nr:peroxisomal targeting signal 2 receptor [Serendipita sp. 397]
MVDPFPVEKCNNYNIKSPYGDFQRPGQPREPSSGSPTSGPTMEPTSSIHTPAFAHHGVAWSPFFENKLAIASSANYGLIGNGRLQVASLSGAFVQPKLVANIDRM